MALYYTIGNTAVATINILKEWGLSGDNIKFVGVLAVSGSGISLCVCMMYACVSNHSVCSLSKVSIKFEMNIRMLISTWLLLTKPWMNMDIFDLALVIRVIACGIPLFDGITRLASRLL